MEHTAFIPAKGNSESVQEKNLQKIGDFTLVEWSLGFALESKKFTKIVLSTESPKVIGNTYQVSHAVQQFEKLSVGHSIELQDGIVIHKRQMKDASKLSKTLDTVNDFLESFEMDPKASITLLQPTSPFRTMEEITEILDLMSGGAATSIASAKIFDSPHPQKSFEVDENLKIRSSEETISRLSTPRQSLKKYFVADGAYYTNLILQLKRDSGFVHNGTYVYRREGSKTINIDNHEDLLFAQFLFEKQRTSMSWIPTL
jgi:CMP-N-acetylneuraminic acid synthetase